MLHSLLNNPTWLPESSSRPSQLDSTAAAFIHLESWGKVENANELSGKLQSLQKKSILVTWGIWRKVMTLLYYAFIGDMETMRTQAYDLPEIYP